MIVDASALLAIILDEPEARDFVATMLTTTSVMSVATWVECQAALARFRSPELLRRAERLLAELGIEIVPVTVAEGVLAGRAYSEYGRSSGHPAALNFGDVFSYALAMGRNEPLLFKGDDFAHTDVRSAVVPRG